MNQNKKFCAAPGGKLDGKISDEQFVKQKWPDAELSKAFAAQKEGGKKWMWCAMSMLKFIATRGRKNRVCNIGEWQYTEAAAWQSAARRIRMGEAHK